MVKQFKPYIPINGTAKQEERTPMERRNINGNLPRCRDCRYFKRVRSVSAYYDGYCEKKTGNGQRYYKMSTDHVCFDAEDKDQIDMEIDMEAEE